MEKNLSSSSTSSNLVSTNGPLNLDNMPDDIYHFYLFDFLNLDDILELRLVSKGFYSKVKSYDTLITKLSLIDDACYNNYKCNWFSTTESIGLRNQIYISNLGLLKNPSYNLFNLRYLRIDGGIHSHFKFEVLNRFTRLQILDIQNVYQIPMAALNLPDLLSFSIKIEAMESKKFNGLMINAPNLQNLRIFLSDSIIDQIKLVHPLSVKYLRLRAYEKIVSTLENLECLDLTCFNNLKIDEMLQLNDLKRLKIDHYHNSTEDTIKLKELIESTNLEIVLYGVKVKKIDKFDEFLRPDENDDDDESNDYYLLKFQLNNYGDLEDDLSFVEEVEYNDLMNLWPDNLPSNMFNKFTNVQSINIVEKIDDENQLIHFIKGCPNLFDLTACASQLSQQFYDQLPAISTLSKFHMFAKNINVGFIARMVYLDDICIHEYNLSSKELNLNNLKRLKRLFFESDNQIVKVVKECDMYAVIANNTLDACDLPVQDYLSLNELTKWINGFKNNKNSKSRKRMLSL